MKKIIKIASWLERVSLVFGGLIIVGVCLKWTIGLPGANYDVSYNLSDLTNIQRLLGWLVDSVSVSIFLYGVYIFKKLMQAFKHEQYFSLQVVELLNRLSKTALVWTLYSPINGMLMSLVTSLHKGVGNRVLIMSIGSSDFIHLFFLGVLVLLTAIIYEGYQLKQEADVTI